MKLSDIKPGDLIIADGGFTCMEPGVKVVDEHNGSLFVPCRGGDGGPNGYVERHYLEGQVDKEGDEVIGFSWPEQGE